MSSTVLTDRKAYIITGPTSGIGRATALELAKHGTLVLVGRDRGRLDEMQKTIEQEGQHAVSVVCDLSDLASVRHAAEEIIALHLPIAGLLNNAGIMQMRATKNAQGWDMTFATNHLGPFALTDALVPQLPDGTNVVFIASAVEDPRAQTRRGFRFSAAVAMSQRRRARAASGNLAVPRSRAWTPTPTSKQCTLSLRRWRSPVRTPRLHFNAVEPGVTPATGLGRDAGAFVRFLSKSIIPPLVPLFNALHEDFEHPEASRARDHQDPDGCLGSDRHLLRRGRAAEARLHARARPEVPRSRRRRDACFAVDGSNPRGGVMTLMYPINRPSAGR